MRKTTLWGTITLLAALVFAVAADRAQAIPAFARKYQTACITCHAMFPRLTALGEAFRLNGFRMPGGDELYVKSHPVSLGADAYKKVFPDAIWPSDIPGLPPLALRVVTSYTYNTGKGVPPPRSTFAIDEATLLAGGSLGDSMSFFAGVEHHDPSLEATLNEDKTITTNLDSGVAIFGWLMWSDLFKGVLGDHLLNARFGTVGKQDLGLPNSRNEGAISAADYLYVDAMDLDQGGPKSVGFELNGFGKHWRYNAGVMNGAGESNKKSFFADAAIKIGGMGYDGSGAQTEDVDLKTAPSGFWRDNSVRLGAMFFRSFEGEKEGTFDRFGADIRLNYADLSLAGGYIRGTNHGEHEANEGEAEKKSTWFAEAEYFVFPWLEPYVRYEQVTNDFPQRDRSRVVFGAVILARANVKFNVEGAIFTKNDPAVASGASKTVDNQATIRLDYAF